LTIEELRLQRRPGRQSSISQSSDEDLRCAGRAANHQSDNPPIPGWIINLRLPNQQ
jgi:hypothetical protein